MISAHLTGAATAQFQVGGDHGAGGGGGGVTTTTTTKPFSVTMMAAAPAAMKKSSIAQLKGGLQLVFDPGMEGFEEESMEEMRAKLARYAPRGIGTVQ
jgi:hypothetical protein